jgi:hypothetical protein
LRNPTNRNVVVSFVEFRERAEVCRANYKKLAKKWGDKPLSDFEYASVVVLMAGVQGQLKTLEDTFTKINTLYDTPKSRLKPIRHKLR